MVHHHLSLFLGVSSVETKPSGWYTINCDQNSVGGLYMKKVMLTAALTGAGDTVEKNKIVPVTPKEIANSVIKSAKAGAIVANIHAREPETSSISHDVEFFKEEVRLIREADEYIIINITSGGGGDFIPNLE